MFSDFVMSDVLRLAIELSLFLSLLLLSAFFSSSETSMFSLKPAQLDAMRQNKSPKYTLISKMLNEPRRLIVTILIGNEFVNITASALSATIIIRLFGVDNSFLNLFVVTPMLLVFGEITPKTLAMKNNVAFASFEAPLIQRFAQLISPLRTAIRFISDGIITLIIGKQRTAASLVTQDMVLTLTQEAVGDGVLESNEAFYIQQVFRFGEAKVEDVMTPRSNVLFVSQNTSYEEIIALIKKNGHSKIPMFQDDQDKVIGVLFGRDLLAKNNKRVGKKGLSSILRKAYFVPGTRQVIDLFHHFRSQHISLALVVDEYGGIIGLVTMDDLLRCIFGDLPQVSGEKNSASKRIKDMMLNGIDALMPVTEFNQLFSGQLPTTIASTMNGLFMHQYGELPPKGAQIEIEGLVLTALSIKGNRINQLRVEVKSEIKKKNMRKIFSLSSKKTPAKSNKASSDSQKTKKEIVDKPKPKVEKQASQSKKIKVIESKAKTTQPKSSSKVKAAEKSSQAKKSTTKKTTRKTKKKSANKANANNKKPVKN